MRQKLTLRYIIFREYEPAGSGFSAWKLDRLDQNRPLIQLHITKHSRDPFGARPQAPIIKKKW